MALSRSLYCPQHLRMLAMAALVVLPATSGGPLIAQDKVAFADSFAALPGPSRTFTTPPGAVDIAAIATPVEAQPEEPRTGAIIGTGTASFYGKRFAGRMTASGERFDPTELTAAHKTLPFGTRVLVTNPRTGQSVTVRINDRGPYARGRMIDLSRAAAEEIGLVQSGHGTVELSLADS